MSLKLLYGCCIGLIVLIMGFGAPKALLVAAASPEKVTRDSGKTVGRRTVGRTSRYVFVGGYYRGK